MCSNENETDLFTYFESDFGKILEHVDILIEGDTAPILQVKLNPYILNRKSGSSDTLIVLEVYGIFIDFILDIFLQNKKNYKVVKPFRLTHFSKILKKGYPSKGDFNKI